MSWDHDRCVTENYLKFKNNNEFNDTYWDDVFREIEYFEDHVSPLQDKEYGDGRCVGEMDVVAVNYGDQTILYREIKRHPGQLSKARDQLDRAESFFGEHDWTVIKQTYLGGDDYR